ncbi:hypothetical protein LKV80_003299 [Salmonella enterica]|nr:hypothetical protein [Salmonella enterica]EGF0274527.1 hypothetical protein [Salmonella enterica]EHK1841155.1 hypothetical protein [Salmonella enterica]EHP6628521.1 hypothetical protein [Salmonella enterica]EIK9404399.1 hypothetical protein [Salmonella enterica]
MCSGGCASVITDTEKPAAINIKTDKKHLLEPFHRASCGSTLLSLPRHIPFHRNNSGYFIFVSVKAMPLINNLLFATIVTTENINAAYYWIY